MAFGMSQSHYQLGFCAYAVYSTQAETVESHEGWLFNFFPFKQGQVSLVSFGILNMDHYRNIFP